MPRVRIALGADHAGLSLKTDVAGHLTARGHEVVDFGASTGEPVDYPPMCAAVGRAVVAHEVDLGIVFGGSGQGEQIAANKVRGVRAALCLDEYTAKLARRHNDANVLSLGGRVVAGELACSIVDAFLSVRFDGGRHQRRISQIEEIEREEYERAREGDR